MKAIIHTVLAVSVGLNLMVASLNLFVKNDRVIGMLHLNLATTIAGVAFLAMRK